MSKVGKRTDVTLGAFGVILVLIVLAVGAFAYSAQELQQRDQSHLITSQQANDGTQQWEARCTPVSRSRPLSCVLTPPQSAAESQRAERDLLAQQQMANWALLMFFATVVGVAVTAVGLIYIVRAYRLNADATEHARIAANAATAQAKTANEAFAAERRPWIAVEDVRLTKFVYEPINRCWNLTVVIRVRNCGQSPARGVFLNCAASGENFIESQKLQDEMRADQKKVAYVAAIHGRTVFPGTQPNEEEWTVSISREEIEQMRAKWHATIPAGNQARKNLFTMPTIYGVVRYNSAYDTDVHTTCFMVTYLVDGQTAFVFDPDDPAVATLPVGRFQGRTFFSGWDAD